MKKMRIGILGKTLLFTFLLVLAVSAFIVAAFSSQFLRYAEENNAFKRADQKAQLISNLNHQTSEKAIEYLTDYQQKHTDSLFLLLDEHSDSVLWCSDKFSIVSVNTPQMGTVLLISDQLSKIDLEQAAASLQQEITASTGEELTAIKEFSQNHPDITVLNRSGLENQSNWDIHYDENGNPMLEPAISGWSSSTLDNYERSEETIILKDGTYRLLIQQGIDKQETIKSLMEILIKVLGISIIPAFLGSFLFAKLITRPVKRLAKQTEKMADREQITYGKISHDEIGDLTKDVYSLYEQLNHTIQELENEMALVKRMENNQRNLFTAASHEMKTPIAAISALLEGMLEEVGDYKNHPKYLRECLRITDSMKKLIAELLEIVRLEEDQTPVQMETIKLYDLLSEKFPLYQAIAEGNKQILEIRVSESQTCIADKIRLSRVMDNVILNALQNTKSQKNVRVWTDENTDEVILNVWNEGAIIPPEEIKNLFEPFFRMDKARSRKDGHSGLGLAITKRLLDSMNIPFSLGNSNGGVLFQIKLHK